jgi:hypothetical protein
MGQGETVICIHGVPTSGFLYRKLLPELASRGLEGVTLDLPGLGLADRPADFDYSWSGFATWYLKAIDQAPKHRIHPLRRQLRPAVEPPSQHGHVSANDILDDKFARDDVCGILASGRGKFVPHQIRKYLANLAKADGAAAGADECIMSVSVRPSSARANFDGSVVPALLNPA